MRPSELQIPGEQMKRACITLWVAVALGTAYAQTAAPAGFVIDAAQVARALAAHGAHVSAAEVLMPAKVVANAADPVLQVLQVSRNTFTASPGRWWVKIGCKAAGACLPFYAVISDPMQQAQIAQIGATGVGLHRLATPRTSSVVIRTGNHATLVIDRERSRIELAVVALENGGIGDSIRVSSADHKQIYRAEVVSGTLLKASMAE